MCNIRWTCGSAERDYRRSRHMGELCNSRNKTNFQHRDQEQWSVQWHQDHTFRLQGRLWSRYRSWRQQLKKQLTDSNEQWNQTERNETLHAHSCWRCPHSRELKHGRLRQNQRWSEDRERSSLAVSDKKEKKKKFYFAKQTDVTTTQIARNDGRLPEKGFHPSKLATYCIITQQNRKNTNVQMCKNVQKNKWWTQNTGGSGKGPWKSWLSSAYCCNTE